MNPLHLMLGIGMIASGLSLAKYGLRNRNIVIGILQLISGIVLVVFGGYMVYNSL